MLTLINTLKRPLIIGLAILLGLSASRILLVSVLWGRVEPTQGLAFILLQGLRFDLILVAMLIGPVLLFKPIAHTGHRLLTFGNWLWPIYLAVVTSLVFFIESATFSFIRQYDSRPNYLFVEYLVYPKELLATLAGSHLLELLVFSAITIALFWVVLRWTRNDPACRQRIRLAPCLLAFPLILIIVFLTIRSSLGHRPVNPSVASFSQDSMVNQLPLNSPYSLMYAIYEQSRDNEAGTVRYGVMDATEMLERIVQEAGITPLVDSFVSGPTRHLQSARNGQEKPQNIVIILEESLGAEAVGSLGGLDLTPWLDKTANEGIWMEQLYATGTRSDRGIEAVITGFTPTSKRSVVKLVETQDNFFTIASLLEKKGYQTSFIYGGQAHFDNMRRFFLNNGFQTVIDQNDYEDPVFVAAWGVSDEDLFNRADQVFSQAGDQPFFSLVFSSSNHMPFDIPPNRVEPATDENADRSTAIKYADYALGQFLEKARKSSYWSNTVFLVIADHNSRVYGNQLVPIERFHIPGVFLGGKIEPRRVPGITSQIDMLPTLLSLAGVSAEHPGIGRDLTTTDYWQGAGRAMMQFNQIFAYMVPGKVVIMQPDLPASAFLYQPRGELIPDPLPDPELEKTALSYALFGPVMIRNKWYRE